MDIDLEIREAKLSDAADLAALISELGDTKRLVRKWNHV